MGEMASKVKNPASSWHDGESEIPAVSNAVNDLIKRGKIAGCVVKVEQDGKLLHDRAQGARDLKDKLPMKRDAIFRIYSMTKPVIGVALMQLVEAKRVALDDPVELHLPEFKQVTRVFKAAREDGSIETEPARRKITVRHLATHSSGLTYAFTGKHPVQVLLGKSRCMQAGDNKTFLQRLCEIPLMHHPGEVWEYSVATDVLGALIERVSGESLGAYLEKRIFAPLGMVDTGFKVPKQKLDRFATSYTTNCRSVSDKHDNSNSRWVREGGRESGGGGLVSTADDYVRFCRMLLNKGAIGEGPRILTEASVMQLSSNNLCKGVFMTKKDNESFRAGFGITVGVLDRDWGSWGHKDEYFWAGYASTHFWISPKDKLIVVALSQVEPYEETLKASIKSLIYKHLAAG